MIGSSVEVVVIVGEDGCNDRCKSNLKGTGKQNKRDKQK